MGDMADDWTLDQAYFGEDEGPSLNLLALWHDEGRICAHCGTEFTKPHGSPTACSFCFRNLTADERSDSPLAVHPEKNKEAHRAEAKKRKSKRKA